ncbi:MAG TPA: hypothetical protein VF120_08805 [Ktedonobacterales bacterium]
MTTATSWTSDPPTQASTREQLTREQLTREHQRTHTLLAERFRLLSMHSFPHLHPELFAHLCESPTETPATCRGVRWTADNSPRPFEPQLFSRYEQLLRESERVMSGVVLLDLDEAERNADLRKLGVSAHRLCSLLGRELREKPVALVLLTRMDYAEIEDLLRAGVSALLHPRHDAEMLAERVRIALRHRQRPLAAHRPVAAQAGVDVVARSSRPEPAASTGPVLVDAPAECPRLAPNPQGLPDLPSERIAPVAP